LTLGLARNAGSTTSSTGQTPPGKPFNGFNERFNLGRGAASGAVCEARRAFDDPLAGQGARVWDVTCRGWSQRLGKLYLFPGPGGARTQAAWRAGLVSRADCPSAGGVQSCKTKPAGLEYAVVAADPAEPRAAGEGLAGIGDLLAVGVRFLEGRTREPATVAEVSASVGSAAGGHVGELTQVEQAETSDARLLDGYRRGEDWRFGDAEARFSIVAAAQGTSAARRAEALYNAALNASDDERFAQADEDFRQADALAARGGNAALENQALDYKAAHARNQGRFEAAIKLADRAVEAHLGAVRGAAVTADGAGGLTIADQSTAADTGGLRPTQREALRAVQALQIKGTSLEALDRLDEARAVLAQARSILDETVSAKSARHRRSLGEASPWLDVRIRADTARVTQGAPGAADALGALRLAVDDFAITNPDTLPLASFRLELARTEMLEANDEAARERSLSDYEAAFAIFRTQRGSLTASADFTRPYFDALVTRIGGDNPAAHAKDVERFFDAAQSLISQSSADAAKRQAEKIRVGDQKAAGLARALEDTSRRYDALTAQRAEAIRNGSYEGPRKTEIDTGLTRLSADRSLLEAQLLNADPRYASALNNLVSVEALQKQLRPGEVYLKVFLLASRGYGVLISPTATRVYSVDISRRDGAELMEAVRPKVASVHTKAGERKRVVAFDVARAHEAFTILFGPVAADVVAAKHVIYEPDVTLIVVPFATYVVDDASVQAMKANLERARTGSAPLAYTGVRWLGAQVSSSIALSAPAFVQARGTPPSTADGVFYGFGDPQISQDDPHEFADVRASGSGKGEQTFCDVVRLSLLQMSALPETADEVATVARGLGQGPQSYAVGPAFTDSDILRRGGPDGDLRRYRVLYFATHGIMSTETRGCMQTALLTSPGDGDSDALLDVVKIPNLHLNADMVVLSACDTGVSAGGNETLGGLVTSFVQAGARNLVVSNWHVESKATQQLMSTMFAQKGVSQADALAIAERAMMSGGRYSHPYFWAPFEVVGDGAKAMPGGGDGPAPQASEARPLSGPAPAP
jgi:hypothetical protein